MHIEESDLHCNGMKLNKTKNTRHFLKSLRNCESLMCGCFGKCPPHFFYVISCWLLLPPYITHHPSLAILDPLLFIIFCTMDTFDEFVLFTVTVIDS